jgi:hypothetical protein
VQTSLDDLTRTESQSQKQCKVQQIYDRLGDYCLPVAKLKQDVSELAKRIAQDDVCLEGVKQAMDACRKSARNQGEDLLEDTLALDALTDLFAEDRTKRKEALARLDALLEEVDVVKSDLVALDKKLKIKDIEGRQEQNSSDDSTDLEAPSDDSMRADGSSESPSDDPMGVDDVNTQDSKHLETSPAQSVRDQNSYSSDRTMSRTHHSLHHQTTRQGDSSAVSRAKSLAACDVAECRRCEECEHMKSTGRMGDTGFEGQWFCSDCWQAWGACGEAVPASVVPCKSQIPQVPSVPSHFWDHIELPLQAETSEERDCYRVSFRMCNPQPSTVNVRLSRDASQLKIFGVHLPTDAESEEMQQCIAQHCLRHGRRSCNFNSAKALYASIGAGKFGSFSECIRLPRDVDAKRVSVSCSEDFLHVTLPKQFRQSRLGFAHPFFR